MSDNDNVILTKWQDLKQLIESLEFDITKNARGVAAAGVRVRKGLRSAKTAIGELVKLTIDTEKSLKEDKK